jgi:hypothetical protein
MSILECEQVQMQPKKKEPWRVTKPFPATEVRPIVSLSYLQC